MTASITTVDVSSFTTDAKFRTWGSAVSAALVASGLTVTSDTGQINWTTVSKPTAINTKAGYEIYRFNDTLQSTKPIFFRIDYGSAGTASGNSPNTWLTVGTGTDGAGTITGVGQIVGASSASASSPTLTACKVGAAYSSTAGSVTIIAGLASSTAAISAGVWNISRTCDGTTGASTGAGVNVLWCASASAPNTSRAQYGTPTNYAASNGVACGYLINSATSFAGGNSVPIYKGYTLIPDPYPVNGFVGYQNSDIQQFTTFSASPHGAAHTYLAMSTTYADGFNYATATSIGSTGAFIWE